MNVFTHALCHTDLLEKIRWWKGAFRVVGFTIRCTPASYQKLHQPTTSSVYELARCVVVVQQRRQTKQSSIRTAQQTLSDETTITVALELAYKKFMNTALRQYTRAVAKELNTYGALI